MIQDFKSQLLLLNWIPCQLNTDYENTIGFIILIPSISNCAKTNDLQFNGRRLKCEKDEAKTKRSLCFCFYYGMVQNCKIN